jgi:hypothetical protein
MGSIILLWFHSYINSELRSNGGYVRLYEL